MNRLQLFTSLIAFSIISIAWKTDNSSSFNTPSPAVLNEISSSTLTFSMDSCSAWVLAGTKRDYTEFTGEAVIDSACSNLSVLGGYLFRDNPNVNAHSCTEGINGSPAMCISSVDNCEYEPEDSKKLKINIEISPGPSGLASLSSLTFYEQAPDTFQWLDGPTGPNNYPTLYAVRILKEGQEIFRQDSMVTGRTWSLQTFNFGLIPEFAVSETTVFNIELLSYCLVGADAPVAAWDLDEIQITSICYEEIIEGGTISFLDGTTDKDICSQDGIPDSLEVKLSGSSGSENAWIITDESLNIIDLPLLPTIDFEGSDSGTCRIWNISYEGHVTGLELGRSLSNVFGCLGLSNSITVNKIIPEASTITDESGAVAITVCTNDAQLDIVNPIVSGGTGEFQAWVISDTTGLILNIPTSLPIDLSILNDGICNLYHISYNSEISGLQELNLLEDISGCYAISNAIAIEKLSANGGSLTTDTGMSSIDICFKNGLADSLQVILNNNTGSESNWLITDLSNNIIDTPDAPPFLLSENDLDTCLIWHLSSIGGVTGAVVGFNIDDIIGCYDLSNPIQVNKHAVAGGAISSQGETSLSFCQANFSEYIVDVDISGNEGDSSAWIIINALEEIISLPAMPPFDFTSMSAGVYNIYHISYAGNLNGLELGASFLEINGDCFAISNPIIVLKEIVDGGSVNSFGSNEINLCLESDTTDFIFFNLAGNSGNLHQWVVTNDAGLIIDLPPFAPFKLDATLSDQCFIWNVSSSDSIPELLIGNNLSQLSGCFDLSDSLVVNKNKIDAGMITVDGEEFISLCVSENTEPILTISSTTSTGENEIFVLTNEAGNIIDFPMDALIDFNIYANGIYNIYKVVYNDTIFNNEPGNNINQISGDCFDISNNVTISLNTVDGGELSTNEGSQINICGNGITSEIVNVILDNEIGINKNWIVTDGSGLILEIDLTTPFDFTSFPDGEYLIWHLSYASGISGMQTGTNVSEVSGCFDFSNSISVTKNAIDGGTINSSLGDNVEFCVNDGEADLLDVNVLDFNGDFSRWIITDDQGIILETGITPPFDFDSTPEGVCYVYHLSYNLGLDGLFAGNEITALEGCFDLSNAITVIRNKASGANILFDDGSLEKSICLANDESAGVDIISIGSGTNSAWLITDTLGTILELPVGPPFSFQNSDPDACLIWHINYYGNLEGLTIDSSASKISGCYALSNSLKLIKDKLSSPLISFADSSSFVDICLNDPQSMQLEILDFNESQSQSVYVVITPQGEILDISYSSIIDISNASGVVCFIRKINYHGSIEGLELGLNVNDLMGCLATSNQIRVQKTTVEPSSIAFLDSTTVLTICINEGMTDVLGALVEAEGSGPHTIWLVTDNNGVIIQTSSTPLFDFSSNLEETCRIQLIDFTELAGNEIGLNIANMTGCFISSNVLTVNKIRFDISTFTSSLEFNMNTCDAFIETMQNADYAELIAEVNNDPQCSQLEVISTSVYVNNPEVNIHSCTNGLNGTTALCISSVDQCTYPVDHEQALRFDVRIIPAAEGVSGLTSLSFYEQAPLQFNHIDGLSGDNNYPTKFGLRILKDDEVVFQSEDNLTSETYTQQTFNFDGVDDFVLTDTTVYRFELTPYCLAGISSNVSAWDLEDIRIESTCIYELLGGHLSSSTGSGQVQICTDDGIVDDIEVQLFGAQSPAMAWMITNAQDSILDIPNGPTFNFEGEEAGTCYLWNISYTGSLVGLEAGNFVSDIQGCYLLSNSLTILKETISTGGCNTSKPAYATELMLRPNPVSDYLFVSTNETVKENARVSLYNRLGQVIKTLKVNSIETRIDISDLSPGYYFIRLDSGPQRMIESFIKI